MAYYDYGTGIELWEAALEDVQFSSQSGWLSPNRRIRILNQGMKFIQERTRHYTVREVITFQSGTSYDTYYELTNVAPSCVKLLTARLDDDEDGIGEVELDIITYLDLMDYRENEYSLGNDVYVWAVNLQPASTPSTVRFEGYPAAPASPSYHKTEFYYERNPTITALDAVCQQPRDLMEGYLRHEIASARRPDIAPLYWSRLMEACNRYRVAVASTGRNSIAQNKGFLLKRVQDLTS